MFRFVSVIMIIVNVGPLCTLARPNNETISKAVMPETCRRKNFCTTKGDYPQKYVDRILMGMPDVHEETDIHLGTRIYNPANNDCKTVPTSEPIYRIVDQKDRVRYVVQSEKRFSQILTIEECLKPGRLLHATQHFTEDDVKVNILECEEKTMDFKFLVLTLDFKGFEIAQAKGGIPVCCSCVYKGSAPNQTRGLRL